MAATKRKHTAVDVAPPPKRRASTRAAAVIVNPDLTNDVFDAPNATRASPDSDVNGDIAPDLMKQEANGASESPLSEAPETVVEPVKRAKGEKKAAAAANGAVEANAVGSARKGRGKGNTSGVANTTDGEKTPVSKPKSRNDEDGYDPEAEGEEEVGEEEVKAALSRPPPVNSDYLPLPWRGRLGYACLNTYLRNSNPPVFSSRTCRIQSILDHRHPLRDPSQPEHATKNRPDKDQPADIERGRRYVEALCLANVKDIIKMVRWNDKYGIKFMRLSSEMFPFASHEEYGYKLAPFASEALAEAGRVVAELGHRVTTHPGQFTQLGSPRKSVIDNSIRDLDYHAELLSLLKLPEQSDRDAVMILHMGGIFEGKQETIQRFRENYKGLPQSVKNRLVLENDDMGWSVHDLLPICEELNIPLCLDFHHNNIVFDSSQIREGTQDIIALYPRIKATWDRKRIRQKMHYSEPTPAAITAQQRRKHNPRVATLPPCPPDMDLMIEAKDKEQAVFELMRTFKLPGFDRINDVVPYTRHDDNKVALALVAKKNTKAAKKKRESAAEEGEDSPEPEMVDDDEVGMGGPECRVYWPPGMEEWLRPKKREVKAKKEAAAEKSPAQVKKEAADAYAEFEANKAAAKADAPGVVSKTKTPVKKAANGTKGRAKKVLAVEPKVTDSSDFEESPDESDVAPRITNKTRPVAGRKSSARKASKAAVNYNEENGDEVEMEE